MVESRRDIVERVLKKFRSRGYPIENDDRFLRALEDWIAGDVEMSTVRHAYLRLLAKKSSANASLPDQIDDTAGDGSDGPKLEAAGRQAGSKT